MDLCHLVHGALLNPLLEDVRRPDEYYVSTSSSVQVEKPWGVVTYGNCHRAEWYRIHNTPITNPPSINQMRKMQWGNAIEAAEIQVYKDLGIYVRSQFRLWIPKYYMAGRGDVLVRDTDVDWRVKDMINFATRQHLVGVEVKSTWSRGSHGTIHAKQGVKPMPKWDHAIQAAIYHWFYKQFVSYWKIVYLARDSGDDNEHVLLVTDDDKISVNGGMAPFEMGHIWARQEDLMRKVHDPHPPMRDFCIAYDKDLLKQLADAGELSKTDTDKVRKGNKVVKGDWQCAYCKWASLCWEGHPMPYDTPLEKLLAS